MTLFLIVVYVIDSIEEPLVKSLSGSSILNMLKKQIK